MIAEQLLVGVLPEDIAPEHRPTFEQLQQLGAVTEEGGLWRLHSLYRIGRIHIGRDGQGYVEAQTKSQRDLLIAPEDIGEARPGDTVLARRFLARRGRASGEVVSVLRRAHTYLLIYSHRNEKGEMGLYDLRTGMPITTSVPGIDLRIFKEGTVFSIDPAENTLREVLGHLGDPNIDEKLSLALFERRDAFPPACVEQAKAVETAVDAAEHPNRIDLRDLDFCTIDPVTAKDFDDAIYFDTDTHTLYVAIADVSHYVPFFSPIDREAVQRGFTTYLPHKAFPMLPRELSENICSLKPRVDRLAFVAKIVLDPETLEPVEETFFEAIIHSKYRFNYDTVDAIIATDRHTEPLPRHSELDSESPLQSGGIPDQVRNDETRTLDETPHRHSKLDSKSPLQSDGIPDQVRNDETRTLDETPHRHSKLDSKSPLQSDGIPDQVRNDETRTLDETPHRHSELDSESPLQSGGIPDQVRNDSRSQTQTPNTQHSTLDRILTWLLPLQKLTEELRAKRMERGFDFRSDEVKLTLNDAMLLEHTQIETGTPSHSLIEECMLLANRAAAKRFSGEGDGIFRIHEPPKIESIEKLLGELSAIGIHVEEYEEAPDLIRTIQQQARKLGLAAEVDALLIRSLKQASYSAHNVGHFGLGFDFYSHFTSPIRRYPDLILHHLIKAQLRFDKKEAGYLLRNIDPLCALVSRLERDATKAEWDFRDRKFARWALENKGLFFDAEVIELDEERTRVRILDAKVQGAEATLPRGEEMLFDTIRIMITGVDLARPAITAQTVPDRMRNEE